MHCQILAAIPLLTSLMAFGAIGPAEARYGHHRQDARPSVPYAVSRQRVHRHRAAPTLPPQIRYGDPRMTHLAPSRGPDFLIHAYLPRFTEVPMYNEPPQRFPQR